MKDFHIDQETKGTVQLVRLAGSLDMYSFPRLESQLNTLLQQGHHAILLDCKDLDYIGSAGLGALIGFAKQAREKGGDVKLLNVPDRIYKIIELLGFTKVLQVHHDETDALASFTAHQFYRVMEKPDNVELKASTNKLSIHTPGHGSYLNYIRNLVGDLARKVGFPDDEVAKVEMSVDEACSNVVKHAYAQKKQWLWQHRHPEIRLDMQVKNNQIIIEIHDHGQKFDFAAYRPDAIKDRLKDMKTNGYGISIMREFMDEVTYSSSDATGNTLRLVKYLKKT